MGLARGFGQILMTLGVVSFALISVSSPLIPRISFIQGQFTDGIQLFIGAWGGCVIVGQSQTCPLAQFGYSVSLENFPNRTHEGPAPLNSTLTYASILYPLAGFLGLFALLFSMPRRSRFTHYCAVILTVTSFLSSAIALIIALLLYVRGVGRINDQFAPATPATLGPAMWISIAGVVCEAFAFMFFAGAGSPKPKPVFENASGSVRGDRASLYNEKHYLQNRSISNPVYHEPVEIEINQGSYYSGARTPTYEPNYMRDRKASKSLSRSVSDASSRYDARSSRYH